MKKLLKKIWAFIKGLFSKLDSFTKNNIHTAVVVVENIKMLADSPVADLLTAIIPGDADEKIKEKLRLYLPALLVQLRVYENCLQLPAPERLECIVRQINLSPDPIKSQLYHGLASLLIQKLSDGKLSISDCIVLSEYYYTNFVKK